MFENISKTANLMSQFVSVIYKHQLYTFNAVNNKFAIYIMTTFA